MDRIKEAQSTLYGVFTSLTLLDNEYYRGKIGDKHPDTLASLDGEFYDYQQELTAVSRLITEYKIEGFEKFRREIFNNLISTQREGQEYAYLCDLAETAAMFRRRSIWTHRKPLVRLLSIYPLHARIGLCGIGYEIRHLLKRLSGYNAFFVTIRGFIINECAKSQLVTKDPQRFPAFSQWIVRSEIPQPQLPPTEPGVKLKWKGDKTDLAELVWALAKSGRVIDVETGKPFTQDALTNQFEVIFGLSLNTMGLMQGRKRSHKTATDGLTFTLGLSELVKEYVKKE